MKLNKYKKLSGDASFRSFYRTKSSIIVYSKKNKISNLLIYDAVNKLLNRNKIIAPRLISNQYSKNFIEIEDFGDETVFNLLSRNKGGKILVFKKILNLLIKIQKIKNVKIKTFKKKYYQIPNYTNKKLLDEAGLFYEWYLKKNLNLNNRKKIKSELNNIFKNLLNKLELKKNVFVHRDFHISNIMVNNNKLALIDSQDAVFGNQAYDLASLIDDVRIETSLKFKKELLKEYFKINKNINKKKLINDFEILSVLRNLKIIGIFKRLSIRDKKHKYLKLIPYAWKLINNRINNSNFKELNSFLKKLKYKE